MGEASTGLPVYDAATGEQLDGTASVELAAASAATAQLVHGQYYEPGECWAVLDGLVWRCAAAGEPGARLVCADAPEEEG